MAEFIEFLSPSALADLKKGNDELLVMIKNVDVINGKMKGITTPSGSDSAVKNMTIEYQKQEKIIASLQSKLEKASVKQQSNNEKTRLSEIKLAQAREKAFDSYDEKLKKEETRLNTAQNLYNKVQAKLNALSIEYKALATQKELSGRLTDSESKRYDFLLSRITKYDTTLKAVDATMGKHQRNVGNYASGFNPLSNSINQLTREMPAFANSVQTGFMAISNNLPIFFDAISQTNRELKTLKAQGEQVPSLFSKLTSSFLTWGTVLSVGVTLLTVYGKEMVTWIGTLIKGSNSLEELTNRQKEFNDAKISGRKDAQSEIIEMKKYLAVVKDASLADDQRAIALKALRSQFPYYFKDLTDSQILLGDTATAEKELTTALEKRKDVEKKTELNVDNKKRLIELEKELSTQKELEKTAKSNLDYIVKQGASLQVLGTYSTDFTKAQSKRIAIEREISETTKQTILNDAEIIKLKKETIALEYSEDKASQTKKERLRSDFAEAESLYNLNKQRLEDERLLYKEISENQNATDYGRLEARKKYSELSVKILDEQFDKENAITKLKYKEDLENANRIYKENKENGYDDFQNNKEWLSSISNINKRYNNEKALSDLKYSKSWKEQMYADASFTEKIRKDTFDKEDKRRKQTIEDIYKLNAEINKSEQKRFLKISQEEDYTVRKRQLAFLEYQNIALKQLQIEKQKELTGKETSEQLDLINQKYKEQKLAIEGLESPLLKAQKATDDYISKLSSGHIDSALNSIGISSAKMFLDIDKNGQSTFDKLIYGATSFGEEMAITFQAVGDIAQDVFNRIAENSNNKFAEEYAMLEKQKATELLFAGDTASAKANIEAQYEEKKRQIANKEAQSKKKQALFNIAIDTAQAIVASFKTDPTGFLAVGIGVLGAIQASLVNAQEVPQFYKGTDNAPEGFALTQEKGREIITDKKGNIKSYGSDGGAKMTFLNKGDKVFTAEKTAMMFNNDLNNLLSNSEVSTPKVEINNSGISDSQINKIVSSINNKESVQIYNDGINIVMKRKKANSLVEITNRRINFTGKSI